ncbi:hypothetical protein MMC27_002015 [Xylographa pallens]|nr:hypothetical protein [Xylographa pallens]
MVFAIYSTILWRRQNRTAITVVPIAGSLTAIACWLLSAKALEGSITIDSTSAILPLVIGNGTSLACGILYSIICTYVFGPDDFDWERFKTARIGDDSDVQGVSKEQLEPQQQLKRELLSPEDERGLRRGKKVGVVLAAVLCAIFVVLWPLPMYDTRYIFSRAFFVGWVVVTFAIAWAASLVIVLMPRLQGGHTLKVFWEYIAGLGVKGRTGGERPSTERWSASTKTEPAGKGGGKKVYG